MTKLITPAEPNNIRNRWRRYRMAMLAYGWSVASFRGWLNASRPDSYSAEWHHANFQVELVKAIKQNSWEKK